MVKQGDRQKAEYQRPGLAPEPEVLVQQVQQDDHRCEQYTSSHRLATSAVVSGQTAEAAALIHWQSPSVAEFVETGRGIVTYYPTSI
jgi:hypothetical protein